MLATSVHLPDVPSGAHGKIHRSLQWQDTARGFTAGNINTSMRHLRSWREKREKKNKHWPPKMNTW